MKNSQQDYKCSIHIQSSTEKVFDSICNVSDWWATNFEGNASNLNDTFHVRFGKTWAVIKIIEAIENKLIVWEVVDCYLNLLRNPEEWKGNKIIWEVSPGLDSTILLTMIHVGLSPGIECYEDCIKGWDFYIKNSLYNLITKGKGIPLTGIMATVAKSDRVYNGILYYINDPLPEVSENSIILDVKKTDVEHVTEYYSVKIYEKNTVNINALKGDHYMLIINKPTHGSISPLDDLLPSISN